MVVIGSVLFKLWPVTHLMKCTTELKVAVLCNGHQQTVGTHTGMSWSKYCFFKTRFIWFDWKDESLADHEFPQDFFDWISQFGLISPYSCSWKEEQKITLVMQKRRGVHWNINRLCCNFQIVRCTHSSGHNFNNMPPISTDLYQNICKWILLPIMLWQLLYSVWLKS